MNTIDSYHSLKSKTTWVSALILSLPAAAMAHPGHYGHEEALPSLTSGFLHSLSGMDYMLLALAALLLGIGALMHRAISKSALPMSSIRMAGAITIAAGITLLIRIF